MAMAAWLSIPNSTGFDTCGTMSLIMKDLLIVKSSLLIMSPSGLIIGTMSPAHCARNTMRATMRATISLIVGLIVGENTMRATMRLIVVGSFKQCALI
jgi:hypothetical protein